MHSLGIELGMPENWATITSPTHGSHSVYATVANIVHSQTWLLVLPLNVSREGIALVTSYYQMITFQQEFITVMNSWFEVTGMAPKWLNSMEPTLFIFSHLFGKWLIICTWYLILSFMPSLTTVCIVHYEIGYPMHTNDYQNAESEEFKKWGSYTVPSCMQQGWPKDF